jgi:hypothetical protein
MSPGAPDAYTRDAIAGVNRVQCFFDAALY